MSRHDWQHQQQFVFDQCNGVDSIIRDHDRIKLIGKLSCVLLGAHQTPLQRGINSNLDGLEAALTAQTQTGIDLPRYHGATSLVTPEAQTVTDARWIIASDDDCGQSGQLAQCQRPGKAET